MTTGSHSDQLRFARRPKPPSRRVKALQQLQTMLDEMRRHGLDVPVHQTLRAIAEDAPDD